MEEYDGFEDESAEDACRTSQGDRIVTVFVLEASQASCDELLSGLRCLKHIMEKRRAAEAA